jgi:hypothetical protein
MRDAAHGCTHNLAVRDIAGLDFQLRLGFKTAIVAESANGYVMGFFASQQALDEMASDLARGAGYEDVLHLLASFFGIPGIQRGESLIRRRTTADPSTAFAAKGAANFAQEMARSHVSSVF